MSIYFVSGIGTDVGKTVATGWLARRWLDLGLTVATVKPVQTGETGFSQDLSLHRALMGGEFLPEDRSGLTNTQRFILPASPHLAAEVEGHEVDAAEIVRSVDEVARRYQRTLVEGAGGLMVPLTRTLLTIDLVEHEHWPVVFVTNGALGSISSTLLSFEALARRGIPVPIVVFNAYAAHAHPQIVEDARGYLRAAAEKTFPGVEWLELPALDLGRVLP